MKSVERVIVADRSEVIRRTVGRVYRPKGVAVAEAATLDQAHAYLAADRFQLLLVGPVLPDGETRALVEGLAGSPDAPYVVGMAEASDARAAEAFLAAGAQEVLGLPFSEAELHALFARVKRFLASLPGPTAAMPTPPTTTSATGAPPQPPRPQILGRSPEILALKYLIGRVAPTDATVFIHGESGTGKELVARALHQMSPRASAPFVKLNCAALPESLVESELFGHERGAFTGALTRREGRFAMANGGTLLLDEVSEVSMNVQSKLLRVLQEREFERVGGNETLRVDVRLIATTNRVLQESIERGEFRQDLYYRLNVVPIHMPPLRDRSADVTILAEWFLEEFCRKHRRPVLGFTPEALDWMRRHTWPGNIRELQNLVERVVIISEECPIDVDLLTATLGGSGGINLWQRAVAANAPGPAPTAASPGRPGAGRGGGPVRSADDLPLFSNVPRAAGPTGNAAQPQTSRPVVADAPRAPIPSPSVAPSHPASPGVAPVFQAKTLAMIEREHILETLRFTGNNRNEAARLLDINIRTLRNKLNEFAGPSGEDGGPEATPPTPAPRARRS